MNRAILLTIAATLTLSGCGLTPPSPGPDGTLKAHAGGELGAATRSVAEWGDRPVRMTADDYASAATLFLGARNVCVGRKTRFHFHAANSWGLFPLSEDNYAYWRDVMASHYPEPLRAWFLKHYGETGWGSVYRFRVLTGAELIAMGVAPECPAIEAPAFALVEVSS